MQKVFGTHNLVIVCGPTATGKTKFAVELAKQYNGELVSADSRQVYIGLDVISGKDRQDLSGIPIWLYDVVPAEEPFSVSLYRKHAVSAITDIFSRGKLPIVVGGTGLYIDAIISPPETIDIPPDTMLRARWNTMTVSQLQQELDPTRLATMNQSDKHNPRRLIRALEIFAWRKKHTTMQKKKSPYDPYWIGLTCSLEELEKRIIERVEKRWGAGALDEARRYPFANAIGIKSIREFFSGHMLEKEAKEEWVRQEVAYAKRQITWFKKRKVIHWRDIL